MSTEEVAVQLRAGIESIPAQVPPGLAGRAYRGYRRRRAATRAAAAAGTATAAAATGSLATARLRMATTEGNHLGLGLSPAKRKQIWDKGLAQAEEIFKEKGAKIKPPANPPTGKALQSDVDNLVWIDSVGALTEGGGDPQVRAGVLRLLSTISGVNVAKSTTAGQPTLTLTWGPGMSGGAGKIVLVINAQTGMPISSWSGDEPPGLNGQPTLPSMTTFQVSRVTLAAVEAGRF